MIRNTCGICEAGGGIAQGGGNRPFALHIDPKSNQLNKKFRDQ
ncbi:MAG TPA: hypothetical protein VHC00_11330 [Rhizobiaceae bacterium]|nr:hypothetical protein [Rhizobiaceae bacterium]